LKQESLNVILTDTLSISKMLPAEKDRQQYPSSKDMAGSIKNMAARPKSEYVPSESNGKHSLKAEGTESFEKTLQYKKFKQFLASGQSPSKKAEKSVNSVFYYFPVL
jgi:hypothetical protein